jgi:hypothetical protein
MLLQPPGVIATNGRLLFMRYPFIENPADRAGTPYNVIYYISIG